MNGCLGDGSLSQICRDGACNDEMNIASSPTCVVWSYDTKQRWADGAGGGGKYSQQVLELEQANSRRYK